MEKPVSIIRHREVARRTGLPRSTRNREIEAGRFPAPLRLTGGRAVGWASDAIDRWVADLAANSKTA